MALKSEEERNRLGLLRASYMQVDLPLLVTACLNKHALIKLYFTR